MLARVFAVAGVLASLSIGAMAADTGPPGATYPGVLLHSPVTRTSLARLLGRGGVRDPWVAAYLRTGDGTEMPLEFVRIGGQRYLYAQICRPHYCTDEELRVLFLPGGAAAYAAVLRGGFVHYVGEPPPDVQEFLRARF